MFSTAFSIADLDRIRSESFVEQVEHHLELASTNDRALEIADSQEGGPFPQLVLAERQTAGRGRGTNNWWAGPGSLTFSILLETRASQLPPRRWPQVSLTVALAVGEAIEGFLDGQVAGLKWPNDVFLQGRKVCGILVEAPRLQKKTLVVGIGINVNNSITGAPAELQTSATALCDVLGQSLSRTDVLLQVLQQLAKRIHEIGTHDEEHRERWRARCVLTGQAVTLDLGTRHLEGICQGTDEEGALLLQTDQGIERIFSGVVTPSATAGQPWHPAPRA